MKYGAIFNTFTYISFFIKQYAVLQLYIILLYSYMYIYFSGLLRSDVTIPSIHLQRIWHTILIIIIVIPCSSKCQLAT